MEEVVPVTNAIKGCPTRWLRDEATGLVTNKVYADGKGPRYDYTPEGKLATRTWARGIVTTYSYDDNGALTNTVYSDGTPTISLVYNRAGQQIEAHDAAGVTTFLYDEFGSLTNEMVSASQERTLSSASTTASAAMLAFGQCRHCLFSRGLK